MDTSIDTIQDAQIASLRIQGLNTREIAAKVGDISHRTVARRLNSDKIKKYQEIGLSILLDHVAEAANTIVHFISHGKSDKIRLDAAKLLLENVGIAASHTSLAIQNLIMVDNRSVLSPGLAGFLSAPAGNEDDHDNIIDIESE